MAFTRTLACLALSGLLAGCSGLFSKEKGRPGRSPAFVGITAFGRFWKSVEALPGETVCTSLEIQAPVAWHEFVLSWNATTPPGTGFKFEARPLYPNHTPDFFTLGYWAEDTAEQRRESVTRQKNEWGDVETDTLVLNQSAEKVQLRITVLGESETTTPSLKFLGLSFLNTTSPAVTLPPNKRAWGKVLAVPERSQLSYSSGGDWCSPTAISMVLAYWSARLNRRELDLDVPEVAAGVFDKNWPGTGNWPFNTAFAGKFPGLRAYVTRLAEVADLESLVNAGIPPVVSVSFDLLHGRTEDKGSGHLVVCVGFDKQGDPIINDPWAALNKGERVQRVIPRANLAKAWARSRQTVYLVYPEDLRLPRTSGSRW